MFIKELYKKGNMNGDENLDIKEVKHIFNSIHMEFNENSLKTIFSKYDENKNGTIEPQEFESLVNDLYSKDEIKFLYDKFCTNKPKEARKSDRIMSISDLQAFLKEENKENLERSEVEKVVSKSGTQEFLSFIEFSYYVFSEANWIIDRAKTEEVYQDMTRPLNEYFIFSSHNTYAMGHQLKGAASPEAYKLAIEKGCRCYELDCWDGPKEPMVTHGFTIMTKCTFKDCVAAIMESGFEQTSYPLIMTLEMHCKPNQQAMIAEILRNEVGERLYLVQTGFENWEELPSPKSLVNKVIVRTSGDVLKLIKQANERKEGTLAQASKGEEIDDYGALSEVQEDLDYIVKKEEHIREFITCLSGFRFRGSKPFDNEEHVAYLKMVETMKKSQSCDEEKDKNMEEVGGDENCEEKPEEMMERMETKALEKMQENEEEEELDELNLSESSFNFTKKKFNPGALTEEKEALKASNGNPAPQGKGKKHSKKSVIDKLNQLLSLFGYNLSKNLEMNLIWNVSSISETNFMKYVQKRQARMIEYTKGFLVRLYPKGTRFDSSNFDPIPGIVSGVQLIALNLQTPDMNHALLTGFFMDNGRCGFVLKPKYLRKGFEDFNPKEAPAKRGSFSYKLELISGQQLGEMIPNAENFGVLDPSVKFSMRGANYDEQVNEKMSFRSRMVDNNGFHPIWKTGDPKENQVEFNLAYPELGLFVVQVIDKADMVIGRVAIPFTLLRPGYRVIPLFSKSSLLAPVPNVYILVHLEITQNP